MSLVGLGCADYKIAVFIANIPPLIEYQALTSISPVSSSELKHIGQQCGNGWRKVFNVYAKLVYALDALLFPLGQQLSSWQQYRDNRLLQSDSQTALLFSPPDLQLTQHQNSINLITGRTYAQQLINAGKVSAQFSWLNQDFAVNTESNIIICPYFDYRQLSDRKIDFLQDLISKTYIHRSL